MADVVFNARHAYTVMKSDSFLIAKYDVLSPITLPNGKTASTVTVKGNNLPEAKGVTYRIEGTFEKYKNSFTVNAESIRDLIPEDSAGIIAYLMTLDGIGEKTAKKLYEVYDKDVFKVIEKSPDALSDIKGISRKKAEKIHESFTLKSSAREIFDFLYRFNISSNAIYRISKKLGEDALKIIKENPYVLLSENVSFKTADMIARSTGHHKDDKIRLKAGILKVLSEAETGGESMNKARPWPGFIESKVSPAIKARKDYDDTYLCGGTFLPKWTLYLLSLRFLDVYFDEGTFSALLGELAKDDKIYMHPGSEPCVYKKSTAIAEFNAAGSIKERLLEKLSECPGLLKTIYDAEKTLGIILSDEQRAAVYLAMTSPISVITGGPGTGKTSIQKILLKVFKTYFPDENVLLCAPTGKAAKRMTEQTGFPAKTLHQAIGAYPDENGGQVITDPSGKFTEKLIITDESSMIGSYLFSALLSKTPKQSRLVIVGDPKQLPSIEVGSVLRELTSSKTVPITRLTKTYRQKSGSSIISNSARINIGEDRLDYEDDFIFIGCKDSEDISEKLVMLMPSIISKYGENNVLCLSPFRRKTASGTNMLNERLRETLRGSLETSKYFISKGIKIFEGDKVMNTKNTDQLANGDIGFVRKIKETEDGTLAECEFNGLKVVLADSQLSDLELAYAITVHKSQGSEASCVVLTADTAHKIILNRNLLYTAVTRAKKQVYILGQKEAISIAISSEESIFRRSNLAALIDSAMEKKNTPSLPEQLTFL